MAKKFAGFKPETLQNKILPALGYSGPTDQASINKFLAANPAAAAKMGKYTMAARQMVEGKPVNMAIGGTLRDRVNMAKDGKITLSQAIRGGSSPGDSRSANTVATNQVTSANTGGDVTENKDTSATTKPEGKRVSGRDMTEKILLDPKAAVSRPTVVGAETTGNLMDSADTKMFVGDQTDADKVATTKGVAATDIVAPETIETKEGVAQTSQEAVTKAGEDFTGAVGQVSDEATYDATTVDPTQSAVLGLQTREGTAAQVDAPDALQVGEGELIEGSTVDQKQLEETLAKSQAASVRDELSSLMKDFEGGDTPAWAAGSMRRANAMLAARGLGASSAAGMAVIQATMEAALPIAQMDAANKQQMAMAKAEQRAKFLGIEFDQEFQAKVKNAARISEVANINFTAEQTIALENARLTSTMDIANLNARSAKTVADTAALASLERANLSAINQAAADNAEAFLQMDFKNLDNEQEAERIRFQATANAIISDTAEKNAMEQLNVKEANDATQFIESLAIEVARTNMEQHNAMERFNAGEENAMAQFNEQEKRAREEFNAEQYRLIEQSNAKFKQQVATDEAAALNAAYEVQAKAANDLSKTAYNNIIMEEKDMMYYAFTGEQAKLDRDTKIATANINAGSGGQLEKGISDIAVEITKGIIENW